MTRRAASAKSLFRALKRQDKPQEVRRAEDFYPTGQPEAIRATALADAGATTHQIAAWTGHESLSEVEGYTRTAARRAAVMGTNEDRTVKNTAAKGVKQG